jgi:hypothetical protein
MRLTLGAFRRRLWELWQSKGQPADWPEEIARAQWVRQYRGFSWPAMETRTWQRRVHELHHWPEPPETDAERLRQRISELHQRLRHEVSRRPLPPLRVETFDLNAGMLVQVPPPDDGRLGRIARLQAELAQAETDLALLLRFGPARAKRAPARKKSRVTDPKQAPRRAR